jgi:SET domain-containing protein
MLLVKNKIDRSSIHGLGLFAQEDIPAGTQVWTFDVDCDEVISRNEFVNLPSSRRDYVQHFGYLNPIIGCFILSKDGARFINHSDEPNIITMPPIGSSEGVDVALVDIARGQELTMDYRRFDADFPRKLLRYFSKKLGLDTRDLCEIAIRCGSCPQISVDLQAALFDSVQENELAAAR